jgi:signal transduction histidine kinase
MPPDDTPPEVRRLEAHAVPAPIIPPEINLAGADPYETIRKLQRINEALINRVERPLHQESNPYSLFEAAITLEAEILARTSELNAALDALAHTNRQLAIAHETLTAANRMKTRFFTAVGHDALQPLHAARLSLSTLGEMTGEKPQRTLIGQIDHSLSSIEEIIKTVLDIAKLEAGVMTPKRTLIQLGDFLAHLHADFAPLAGHKGLAFSVPPSDITVASDALMLRRILQNLVANAVRYTRAGRIRLLVKVRGEFVRIEVWDTGIGVRAEDKRIIFNEFQRGEDVEAAGDPGLGLGLSIVQRMADVLEHPLGMMSRLGRGSCFHISVPLAQAEERIEEDAPARSASPVTYGMPKAQIVIIDNNEASLVALAELLRRWNCTPRIAADLESIAAYAALESAPDLIIADFHLDRGELGTQAVALLRDRFGPEIPAVILTADRSLPVAETIREARCELMNKPARPAELRALVSHLLG